MALRRGHLECGANCWPDAVTSSQHVYEVRPRKGLTPNDIPPVHAVSRKDIGCAPLKPQR